MSRFHQEVKEPATKLVLVCSPKGTAALVTLVMVDGCTATAVAAGYLT